MHYKELKEKIYEIALIELQNQFGCGDTVEVSDREACAESIAYALIAAGIGDVKEAEHRALVAERALKILIKNQYSRCAVPTELCSGIGCRSNECQKIILEYYLQQAKKELAEENSGKKEV